MQSNTKKQHMYSFYSISHFIKQNYYTKKNIFILFFLFHSNFFSPVDFSGSKVGNKISLYCEDRHVTQKTVSYISNGYEELKTYFDTDLNEPVKIYIVSSDKTHSLYFNIPNRDFISGFAKLKSNEIYVKAPAMLRYNIFDFEKVLKHELAHIFIENVSSPHTPPRWLHEGLAMELEPMWYWINPRAIVLPYAFLSNQLIPFKNLNTFPPEKKFLQISYEQSRDFVNYLITNFGQKKMLLLLENYRNSGDIDSAVILTYGQPLDDIEYLWRQDLKTKYTWFYILRQTNFFWFLISLSANRWLCYSENKT